MPELPEVETVMRGLAARLEGRVLVRVTATRADLRWPLPPNLASASGRRVHGFARRAKYMLMRLEGGMTLILHLGMSGRIVLSPPGANTLPPLHEHVVFETDEGWRAGFVDPRRFGSLDMLATADEAAHPRLAALGPEPLGDDFTADILSAALAGRHTPIKAALLDQRTVAGLGNIYVCEALFRARISPRRLAHTVAGARAGRLVPAIKETLAEAIAAGGSSLRDYRQANGELGYFQHAWKVYGRGGEACERCPGPPSCSGIAVFTQAGRSSFSCPKTQR